MSDQSRDLGTRIYLLRVSRGLSAMDLARCIGCTPSYIFNWEAGRDTPPERYLKAMARIFYVSEFELARVAC